MGILRIKDEQRPIRVEEITYADYVFDDTDDEENSEDEVQETHVASSTPSRRRRQRVSHSEKKISGFADLECLAAGVKIKRRMGSRKLRRLENARYMCALADPNDICDDFSDILPDTVSAFAQLFIDQSKMKAWNEFIEKDEEEQLTFLEESKSEKKIYASSEDGYCLGRSPGRNNNLPEKVQVDEDSRNHHPAYSAGACFARLDVRFQSLFAQRRLPWEFMKNVEDALRTFFLGEVPPGGEWTSLSMPSALHRLILHGISQYLSLQSTSVANGSEEKFVKVCNARPFFIPPHKHLVSYLKHRHRAGK